MRPLRAMSDATPASSGMRDAARLMTEDWRIARRVRFAMWKGLLAAFLQYRLAITRLCKHLVECGFLAQVFEQGIVKQGSIGAVVLLHSSFQKTQRRFALTAGCHQSADVVPVFSVGLNHHRRFVVVDN